MEKHHILLFFGIWVQNGGMKKRILVGGLVITLIILGVFFMNTKEHNDAEKVTDGTTQEPEVNLEEASGVFGPDGQEIPLSHSTTTEANNNSPAPHSSSGAAPTPQSGSSFQTTVTPQTTKISSAPFVTTVYYDGTNFTPETVTIIEGSTLIFENTSDTERLWVASNPHPSHTRYPETSSDDCSESSFDQCASIGKNQTWSFTFTTLGDWTYHNHLRPVDGGHVNVLTKEKYLEMKEKEAKSL